MVTAGMCPCTLCPTVTAMARQPDCERIRIDGRRTGSGLWQWTVDVITDDRDAHANTPDLSASLQIATQQLTSDP